MSIPIDKHTGLTAKRLRRLLDYDRSTGKFGGGSARETLWRRETLRVIGKKAMAMLQSASLAKDT